MFLRPLAETNHEFFVHVLKHTLGPEWKTAQDALPEDQRHPIVAWVDAWDAMRTGQAPALERREERAGVHSAEATGDLRSLICIAYDAYTLRHSTLVSPGDPLVTRLGNRAEFPGVRYEIAIAAIFIRAGFQLEWITDVARPRPEFVGRHALTGTEVEVEAKSRNRPGLLGRGGDVPDRHTLTVDVEHLYRAALEKQVDDGRPYVVSLELNLPPGDERPFQERIEELHESVFAPVERERPEDVADPVSAVIITNLAWHWDGEERARDSMTFLARTLNVERPLPEVDAELLAEALFQYGDVPETAAS